MWKITKIKIENLFSFSELEYEPVIDIVTCIVGLNKDDTGQESNNSGKSAFAIECIALGLQGSCIRDLKISEVVRDGCKKGSIYVTLHNTPHNKVLEIERTFYKSTVPSKLIVTLNDEVKIDTPEIGTISDGNKFILEELDISASDLFNYYIIAKGKYTSFFHSNDNSRKALINRFSNTDHIDKGIVELKNDIKDQKKEVENLLSSITRYNDQLIIYKERLDAIDTNLQEYRIKELQSQINTNKSSIVTYREQIETADKELAELSTQKGYDELKSVNQEINQLQNITDEARIRVTETDRLMQNIRNDQSALEKKKITSIECPKCNHIFNPNDKTPVDINFIDSLYSDYTRKYKELTTLQENFIKNINSSIKQIETLENEVTHIRKQIKEKDMRISYLNTKKTNLKEEILRINNENKSIQHTIDNWDDDPARKDKENIQSKIKEIQSKVKDTQKEHKKQAEHLDNLEKSLIYLQKFRTHLANNALDVLTLRCNEFLKKIKSDYSIKFLNFKKLASEKEKEEISIQVLNHNKPLPTINRLSEGTLSRIEIGIILAVQDLINQNSKYGGLNLLILDEITLSLDEMGIYSIIDSLKTIPKTIFILTPIKINKNVNIVQIIKQNKISKCQIKTEMPETITNAQ